MPTYSADPVAASVNGLVSRSLKVRQADYTGATGFSNFVEFQCATGSNTNGSYTIVLPSTPPNNPNQVLTYNGLGAFEWKSTSSGGFFYAGATPTTQASISDGDGNVLTVFDEVPLVAGDPGYDPALPYNGGTKINTKFTNQLYNMKLFQASQTGQAYTVVPRQPDNGSDNSQVGLMGSGITGSFPIGTAITNATEISFGALDTGFPSTTGNLSGYNDGTLLTNTTYTDANGVSHTINASVNDGNNVNAQNQYQDTVNIVTRRVNNSHSVTSNDFSYVTVNPEQVSLNYQTGAGTTGTSLGDKYSLAVSGDLSQFSSAPAGASQSLTFTKNSDNLVNVGDSSFTLKNLGSTTSQLVGDSTGLNYTFNGQNQLALTAASAVLADNSELSKLTLNSTSLTYGLGASVGSLQSPLSITSTNVVLQTGNGVNASGDYQLTITNDAASTGTPGFLVTHKGTGNQRFLVNDSTFSLQSKDSSSAGVVLSGSGNASTSEFSVKVNNNKQVDVLPDAVTLQTGAGSGTADNFTLNLKDAASGTAAFTVSRAVTATGNANESLLEVDKSNFTVTNSAADNAYATVVTGTGGAALSDAVFTVATGGTHGSSVPRVTVNSTHSTLQVDAANSKLDLTGTALNYTLDANTFLTGNTNTESLFQINKGNFKLASTTTTASAQQGVSDVNVMLSSNVATGASSTLDTCQFTINLTDNNDATLDSSITNKTKNVVFNRTPFFNSPSDYSTFDFNTDSANMKFAVGLPQIELTDYTGTKRCRLFVHKSGDLFLQRYDTLTSKWVGANLIVDSIPINA